MSLRQFQPSEFLDFAEKKIRELYAVRDTKMTSSHVYTSPEEKGYSRMYLEKEFEVDSKDVVRLNRGFGYPLYGKFSVMVGRLLGFSKEEVKSVDELLAMDPQDKIVGVVTYHASIPIEDQGFRTDWYHMMIKTDDFQTITKSKGLKQVHSDRRMEEPINVPLQELPLEEALYKFILMTKTLEKDK
ncbi:hypothetical protein J4480_05425 [Candidatus Woesearchaeota archaeon]|nr:hypothetical protein [Candidatus Woesearchaeota archaeon]